VHHRLDMSSAKWLLVLAGCATSFSEDVPTEGDGEQSVFPACGFANAAWDHAMIPQQYGRFTLSFYAQAGDQNRSPIDAVIGLGNGRADAFSDLAAIVRFNAAGKIDVRNGGTYMADVDYPYRSTTFDDEPELYLFAMDVDIPARRYSVTVRTANTEPVRIADSYAFRTEQANVTRLDTMNGFLDSPNGYAFYCDGFVTPSTCKNTLPGTGWANTAFPSQTGEFWLEVDAVAGTNNIDAVVGLSRAGATRFSDLAAIVRFNPNGYFDARDGDVYRADLFAPYYPGELTTIAILPDVATKTYSAAVENRARGEFRIIASGYRFRTEQAGVTSLGNLGQFLDVQHGAVTTCDLVQGNYPM
jgi:hypothetical protein